MCLICIDDFKTKKMSSKQSRQKVIMDYGLLYSILCDDASFGDDNTKKKRLCLVSQEDDDTTYLSCRLQYFLF